MKSLVTKTGLITFCLGVAMSGVARASGPDCRALFLAPSSFLKEVNKLVPNEHAKIQGILELSLLKASGVNVPEGWQNLEAYVKIFTKKDLLSLFGTDVPKYPAYVGTSTDGQIIFVQPSAGDPYLSIISVKPVAASPLKIDIGFENDSKSVVQELNETAIGFNEILQKISRKLDVGFILDYDRENPRGTLRYLNNGFDPQLKALGIVMPNTPIFQDRLLDRAYLVRSTKILNDKTYEPATIQETANVIEALLDGRGAL